MEMQKPYLLNCRTRTSPFPVISPSMPSLHHKPARHILRIQDLLHHPTTVPTATCPAYTPRARARARAPAPLSLIPRSLLLRSRTGSRRHYHRRVGIRIRTGTPRSGVPLPFRRCGIRRWTRTPPLTLPRTWTRSRHHHRHCRRGNRTRTRKDHRRARALTRSWHREWHW